MNADHDLETLVSRARDGDRSAFETASDACADRLRRFVETRVGGHLREVVDVDDVLQETWVQALKSIAAFRWRGHESFLRWLNAIAEHVILGLARRHRVDRSRFLFLERATGDVPDGEPTPSKALRRRERLGRFEAALDGLPDDYREAVRLVRIEGLPVKEAARRMGRTPKSVAHLLARALIKLRETFSDTASLTLPPAGLETRRKEDDGGDRSDDP